MGKKNRRVLRILFAVGIIVKVVAIYAVVFSGMCVVNGSKFGMLLPFGIGIAMWIAADSLTEAVGRRMK